MEKQKKPSSTVGFKGKTVLTAMAFNRSNQIRMMIKQTRGEDGQLARLRAAILDSIPRLHTSIHLPPRDADGALTDFVVRYIEHVPNCIDAFNGLTRDAGIHRYVSVFLSMAEDFFLHPPGLIRNQQGLWALMAQAYLAHRLIEEVNDRVVARCGIPLAPMDMTRANLVVHQLIGEPFSNDLDFVVHYATERYMDQEHLMNNQAFHTYVSEHRTRGWDAELTRWPCLAEDLSISISFATGEEFPVEAGPRALH